LYLLYLIEGNETFKTHNPREGTLKDETLLTFLGEVPSSRSEDVPRLPGKERNSVKLKPRAAMKNAISVVYLGPG